MESSRGYLPIAGFRIYSCSFVAEVFYQPHYPDCILSVCPKLQFGVTPTSFLADALPILVGSPVGIHPAFAGSTFSVNNRNPSTHENKADKNGIDVSCPTTRRQLLSNCWESNPGLVRAMK